MRSSLILALLLLPCCSAELDFVRPQRLAYNGEAAAGATILTSAPTMLITARIASDATDFDPTTVLRLLVNGVDRTAEMTIGGDYATLTLDPPPAAPQFVELFMRTGTEPLDTATYEAMPYAGPTLASVTPDTAQSGAQVTIAGTGFLGGPLRVFFGGVEGAVDSSTDTEIVATVPDDAIPGLVFVLVGNDSAVGMVPFLPLDDLGAPVPMPTSRTVFFYMAPARGPVETVITVAGLEISEDAVLRFDGSNSARVYNIHAVNFPLIGDVIVAYGVAATYWDAGTGDLRIRDDGDSNELPFTVE